MASDNERPFDSPDSLRATRRRFAGRSGWPDKLRGCAGRRFGQGSEQSAFGRAETGYDRFQDGVLDCASDLVLQWRRGEWEW